MDLNTLFQSLGIPMQQPQGNGFFGVGPTGLPPGVIDESGAFGGRPPAPPIPGNPWANPTYTPDSTGHSMMEHPGQVSPDGYLSGQAMNIQNNGITPPTGTPINGEGGEQVVTGDGWHPHKVGWLGRILDAYVSGHGGGTPFADRKAQRNINEAMAGFDQDPLGAIRRMAQIKGHEMDAWKMYGQYRDDDRADQIAKSQNDVRLDRARDIVGGMMSVANADNWERVRPIVSRYWTSRGGDEADIPTEFDPDLINSFRYGSDKVYDNDRADRNTESMITSRQSADEVRRARLAQQGRNTDSMISHRQAQESETGRHNRVMEAKPTGRGSGKSPMANKFIKDREGNILGQVNPRGDTARIKAPDGGYQYFEVLPNGKLGKRVD